MGEVADWVLVDLEARVKAQGQEEIVLPPLRRRESLRFGWFAKLRLEEPPTGSRKPPVSDVAWVRVVVELADGKYEGAVVSPPELFRRVKKGSVLSFEPKNVLDFVDL